MSEDYFLLYVEQGIDIEKADGKGDYGKVSYADSGHQPDKKPRYPVDTEEHVRAAWNYIHQARNAAKYSSEALAEIKGKILAAWRRIIGGEPPSAHEGKSFSLDATNKDLLNSLLKSSNNWALKK